MNRLQHDLIIGSLLGDGTIEKQATAINPRFRIGHGQDQKDYCQMKFEVMKDNCRKEEISFTTINNKVRNKTYYGYYFVTRNLPEFHQYRNINIIDQLNALNENSFTIWFLDDGCLEIKDKSKKGLSRYRYELSMKRFTEHELEYCRSVLLERFGLESKTHRGALRFYGDYRKRIMDIMLNSDFGYIARESMSYKLIGELLEVL